jgi:23S rRNA G2069 N7-methylase RlmK/C1962 C5-methylase RlmI
VIHRNEIPILPASIDRYGPWFNAVWYDERTGIDEAAARLAPWLDRLVPAGPCRGGVIRLHGRDPHRRGLVGGRRYVGEKPPDVFHVHEHGLRYLVDLTRTQHAGLFLDQRDTRRRVSQVARGVRVANLFAFTCSFSVAAARAGCEVVFSVDSARACLETGKKNFAFNRLDATGSGKFIQEDARRWLERQLRRRDERPDAFTPLDLVICDPPVFAGGKGKPFSIAEEWPRLADAAAGLLGPDGQALFANNHRGGDHGRYRAQLAERFAVVEDLKPPLDFPELAGAEPHVRMFWCRRSAARATVGGAS